MKSNHLINFLSFCSVYYYRLYLAVTRIYSSRLKYVQFSSIGRGSLEKKRMGVNGINHVLFDDNSHRRASTYMHNDSDHSGGMNYLKIPLEIQRRLDFGDPTSLPTSVPTSIPTNRPSSSKPTTQPSRRPSQQPLRRPSQQPSLQPLFRPSSQPRKSPTRQPSKQPVKR